MTDDIINLQIKVAHLENALDALDKVIIRQDQTIKDLQDQLKLLYRCLENQQEHSSFDALTDRPPHY